jgi:hypothetical protein
VVKFLKYTASYLFKVVLFNNMGVVGGMGWVNCDWFSFYGDMEFVWLCLIIVCGCLYALIF